jgi:hypothetical protein
MQDPLKGSTFVSHRLAPTLIRSRNVLATRQILSFSAQKVNNRCAQRQPTTRDPINWGHIKSDLLGLAADLPPFCSESEHGPMYVFHLLLLAFRPNLFVWGHFSGFILYIHTV